MNIEAIISKEFPQDDDLIYLNHAAVSPWPRRSCDAVCNFAVENTRYGAKNYPAWMEQEEQLREQLKKLVNAESIDDIALVKNTSEALSMVAGGIDWHRDDNVVSTNQEFPSNRIVWQAQEIHGVEFREVDISTDSPEKAIISACDNQTRVLAISSVQYGSGFKIDLEKLGRFCQAQDIIFCVDAIQSLGAHQLDVQNIKADFVMADAHKWLLGPEGIALFYSKPKHREQLRLHEYGWHMVEHMSDYDRKDWQIAASARRFECGSPNTLGCYAFSASLSLILEIGMEAIESRIQAKTGLLVNELDKAGYELLSARPDDRRAGIVTFRIPGKDMTALQQQLLHKGVICACRYGGIRFSPHFYTSEENIYKALEIVKLSI